MLDLVSGQGKPVVLVMLNGRPYTIPEEVKKVDAVLEAWYPGEKGLLRWNETALIWSR